jgi:hypothetical protein
MAMSGSLQETLPHRRGFRFVAGLMILALPLGGSSCIFPNIKPIVNNAIEDASNQLDQTIDSLQNTSTSWQVLLKDLLDKLTGDARNLIGTDIQNLINNSVAVAGAEVKCEVDFIRARIVENLVALKNKLLGKPMPVLEPRICQAVPMSVDVTQVPASVRVVNFYGYNFGSLTDYVLKMESLDGTQTDVTRALNIPTAYAMTLSLGPSGASIAGNAHRFNLSWQGKPLSTVGIIQPAPVIRICKTETRLVDPQDVDLVPQLVRGDGEFGGNGPTIRILGSLTTTPAAVNLRLAMAAKETKNDWTTVNGTTSFTVFAAPSGFAIEKVASVTRGDFVETTRQNWDPEDRELGSGGLFKHLKITGDTDGSDAGKTRVRASLNTIEVVLRETGNCQSALALSGLIGTRFINPGLSARIAPSVGGAMRRMGDQMRAVQPQQ